MIKTLDDSYGKILWEMYLESVRPERVEPFPLPASPPLPLETASADPLQFSPERFFGSIRLLDDGDFLILFTIIAQLDADRFTALKVSNFTQFGIWCDLGFLGTNGEYIAELDNSFTLSLQQVMDSVVLDETDAYTFLQIEGASSAEGNLFSGKPLYWENIGHWRAQFRIKEHEITCAYRPPSVRSPGASLWIPQLELHSGVREMRSYLQAPDVLPELDLRLEQDALVSYSRRPSRDDVDDAQYRGGRGHQDRSCYSMEKPPGREPDWYQLAEGPEGWELRLAKGVRGRFAHVYNGEYLIYKGILPPSLELSRYARLSRWDIEKALDLRLDDSPPDKRTL